jgi:hypothetical protein
MALRFLADHCISNTIVRALRDATHGVVRLKDVLPVESPDTIVIAKAQEIDAIFAVDERRFRRHRDLPAEKLQGYRTASNAQPRRGSGPFDVKAHSVFKRPACDGTLPWEVARGRSQPHTYSRVGTRARNGQAGGPHTLK